jgi:hypothetical protein
MRSPKAEIVPSDISMPSFSRPGANVQYLQPNTNCYGEHCKPTYTERARKGPAWRFAGAGNLSEVLALRRAPGPQSKQSMIQSQTFRPITSKTISPIDNVSPFRVPNIRSTTKAPAPPPLSTYKSSSASGETSQEGYTERTGSIPSCAEGHYEKTKCWVPRIRAGAQHPRLSKGNCRPDPPPGPPGEAGQGQKKHKRPKYS